MSKKSKNKRRKKPGSQSAAAKPDARESSSGDSSHSGSKLANWAIPVVLIVGAGILLFVWFRPIPTAELVDQIRTDHQLKQHALVLDSVQQLQDRGAADVEVLTIGADSAVALRQYDRAIELMDAIDDEHGESSVEARVSSGEILFDKGNVVESEEQFRRALAIDPDHIRANQRLAILLNVLGRRYESAEFAFKSLKAGQLDLVQLVLFSNRLPSADVGEVIELFVQESSGDPGARLTAARELVITEKPAAAIELLKEILRANPDNTEASVFLGKAYWATSDEKNFAEWFNTADEQLKQHPEFWNVAGDWAYVHDQPEAAARAYWEVLSRDPDNHNANYRLAKLLKSKELAASVPGYSVPAGVTEKFAVRSESINALNKAVSDVMDHREQLSIKDHGDDFRTIVEQLEALGRNWEAYAWTLQALNLDPRAEWAIERRDALRLRLNEADDRYARTDFPAGEIDLAQLPEIRFKSDQSLAELVDSTRQIQFTNATKQAGIDFMFHNATVGADRAVYMYQLMGGSAGIVDFNLDGLPDIYFPQGCDWPIDPAQKEFLDKLFENRGDGTFVEVSSQAGVVQNGFGQSVTVGDFDADGFSDLYVVNIAGNRLLRNNGDGTFADVTEQSRIAGDDWTCGAAMVDVDGDALPDLCDVNYLGGSNVFTKTCLHREEIVISCPPRDFEPTRDRIRINQGDGSFIDITDKLKLAPGKGLGIVAGDINGDGRIDLFIGNDGEANVLLLNESDDDGVRFSDMAPVVGVDLDSSGDAQACMGIAVLDSNRDKRIDLFITNFAKENNTLYQSDEFGFTEATRKANLSSPGYGFVGFGTQALDAELDGDEDLLITNGHVQDFHDPDTPFEMPAIFLENTGGGRFRERGAGQVGTYFGLPQVGRGMARLDWNRDGLEEVVIVNLDRPAVLLKNESTAAGGFISIRLIGTGSGRDAIGSSVVVSNRGIVNYRQLTAGDGYAASNQRELVFAVRGDEAEKVQIQWLSGLKQTFENVTSNRHYIAIEGRDELFPTN